MLHLEVVRHPADDRSKSNDPPVPGFRTHRGRHPTTPGLLLFQFRTAVQQTSRVGQHRRSVL